MDKELIRRAQAALILNEWTGNGRLVADGEAGQVTREVVLEFQYEYNLECTGELDEDTLAELNVQAHNLVLYLPTTEEDDPPDARDEAAITYSATGREH